MVEAMIEPTTPGTAENVILALQKVITLLDKIKKDYRREFLQNTESIGAIGYRHSSHGNGDGRDP